MKKNVIATDLDGTLFYPKRPLHIIAKRNRVFLNRFTNDGGLLVLSTSRCKFFAVKTVQ